MNRSFGPHSPSSMKLLMLPMRPRVGPRCTKDQFSTTNSETAGLCPVTKFSSSIGYFLGIQIVWWG